MPTILSLKSKVLSLESSVLTSRKHFETVVVVEKDDLL
jgi:hypothetical protein